MFISMNWIAEYVDLSDYDRQARLDLIQTVIYEINGQERGGAAHRATRSSETADAAVETAAPESAEAENGQVAAKEGCCSEEWVALAAHNLEDGCAPLAI